MVMTVLAMPDPTQPPAKTDCPPVPAGENMTITPTCMEGPSISYNLEATGFKPEEALSYKFIGPDEEVITERETQARADGKYMYAGSYSAFPITSGQYSFSLEGLDSGHKATGYLFFEHAP
jgi:hypothetical protein